MDNQELLIAIREIVKEELKPVKADVSGLKEDMSGVKADVSGLKEDMSGVKADVSGLKEDMSGVKADVSGLKEDMSGVKKDVSGLKEDMDYMKITLKEQGQILNALEHKLDVVKAEQENMKHDVNKLVGKAEGMENILSIVEAATAHNWNEIVKLKSVK